MNCPPIVKYFIFLVVYIFSFILMFKQNYETIGIQMLFVIQTAVGINILLDIFRIGENSFKFDLAFLPLFFCLAMMFIATYSIAYSMTTLKQSAITKNINTDFLSPGNRDTVSQFKILVVLQVFLLLGFTGLFMGGSPNGLLFSTPFFRFNSKFSASSSLFLFLKGAFVAFTTLLSIYLVILASKISFLLSTGVLDGFSTRCG